jgi:hypothetical protein
VHDALADDAAEQSHVREEGQDVEDERHDDPSRRGIVESREGVLHADEPRQKDVDRRHQDEHNDEHLGDAFRVGEERGLGVYTLLDEIPIDRLRVAPHPP